jgi:hypothetical protein
MKHQMHNYFAVLNDINVSDHVEKKGQFSYLSWPFAVAQLRLADPSATWEVKRFDGLPYLKCDTGHFVEVAVTVEGVTLSQLHPVLDGKNKPIASPTAFDINTSIQRCLVKAIALHGLGLYIYAGEDLPEAAKTETLTVSQQETIKTMIEEVDGNLDRLLAYFKVKSLGEILAIDYERVVRALQKGRKAA